MSSLLADALDDAPTTARLPLGDRTNIGSLPTTSFKISSRHTTQPAGSHHSMPAPTDQVNAAATPSTPPAAPSAASDTGRLSSSSIPQSAAPLVVQSPVVASIPSPPAHTGVGVAAAAAVAAPSAAMGAASITQDAAEVCSSKPCCELQASASQDCEMQANSRGQGYSHAVKQGQLQAQATGCLGGGSSAQQACVASTDAQVSDLVQLLAGMPPEVVELAVAARSGYLGPAASVQLAADENSVRQQVLNDMDPEVLAAALELNAEWQLLKQQHEQQVAAVDNDPKVCLRNRLSAAKFTRQSKPAQQQLSKVAAANMENSISFDMAAFALDSEQDLEAICSGHQWEIAYADVKLLAERCLGRIAALKIRGHATVAGTLRTALYDVLRMAAAAVHDDTATTKEPSRVSRAKQAATALLEVCVAQVQGLASLFGFNATKVFADMLPDDACPATIETVSAKIKLEIESRAVEAFRDSLGVKAKAFERWVALVAQHCRATPISVNALLMPSEGPVHVQFNPQ